MAHTFFLAAILLSCFSCSIASGEASLPTYSGIRTDVTVRKAPMASTGEPRPAGFFQLAGSANQDLCAETLSAFNEPGRYHGDDGTRWLLDNPREVAFRSLDPAQADPYVFPGFEYASLDLDADGRDEHIYRLNGVIHSQWYQRLMIVPDHLQSHRELLTSYSRECMRIDPKDACDSTLTMIRYAVAAGVPDRLPNEWAFSRHGAFSWATGDAGSRKLIFPHSRNQAERNIGSSSGMYWGLYRMKSAAVLVSVPSHSFAPPELLVFAPDKEKIGVLQCVLMPVAWHR